MKWIMTPEGVMLDLSKIACIEVGRTHVRFYQTPTEEWEFPVNEYWKRWLKTLPEMLEVEVVD